MDKYVVSDQLSLLLKNKKVIASVFTTYNFESDFFELDVIPLLLENSPPYSSDARIKTFQVREALRESKLKIEVFYDLGIFRQNPERSPEMEYFCHGVNQGNSEFHAKNIFLLIQDVDTDEQSLLISAGSNNITRAGWWENIEVLHWEVIKNGEVQRAFVNRLSEDVDWLLEHRSSSIYSALELIKEFLDNTRGWNDATDIYYYGLSSPRSVFKFLSKKCRGSLDNYQNWTLEIISPFFVSDTKSDLHNEFITNLGVKKVIMLLPRDQERSALCEQDYYRHINESEDITWGRWNSDITKSLGMSNDLFRRVHAKIYHFYNGVQSWVFIGSVNFSYKAIYENIESGFLVKLNDVEPLLEKIPEDVIIESFNPPLEDEPGVFSNAEKNSVPELHLRYDWKTKSLSGRTASRQQFEINIKNKEGNIIIGPWLLKYQENIYAKNITFLEDLLSQGSLISVNGNNFKTKDIFPEHLVMLIQTGWTHKPIDLPDLTPEQILAIYAGMSPERRQLMLMNAQVQQLILKKMSGELTSNNDEIINEQFFCEYAELFDAFRKLKLRLITFLDNDDVEQVDYYLTGTGMDSLPSLIKRTRDINKENYNAVINYLILLSVKEFYSNKNFKSRPNVSVKIKGVIKEIKNIKSGTTISLEENSPDKRKVFFSWFEEQFYKEYVSQVNSEDLI